MEAERDYLEVIFKRKECTSGETANERVMEKVDTEGETKQHLHQIFKASYRIETSRSR
jgi:hypothetical protein